MLLPLSLAILQATAAQPAPTARSAASTEVFEPLRYDRKGRPVMRVSINGSQPHEMVIDTAAQVSLVTEQLANELKLPVVEGGILVDGATDTKQTGLRGVDRLHNAVLDLRELAMPVLHNAAVTDARGIIGIDAVGDRKLVLDRVNATVTTEPSAPAANGYVAVKGDTSTGLLVVPMTINGRTVRAVIDSGAEGSIADGTLPELLGWTQDDPRLKAYGTIGGAGSASIAVRVATMETVQLGPVVFRDVPIVITPNDGKAERKDGAVPTVILGSDMLNLLTAYAVDFPRSELQIRMPAGKGMTSP